MRDTHEIDFEMMDELSKDEHLAHIVTSHAVHWHREGFMKGQKFARSAVKIDRFITFFCVFVIGFISGPFFIHYPF